RAATLVFGFWYLAFGIWFLAFGSYFFGSRLNVRRQIPSSSQQEIINLEIPEQAARPNTRRAALQPWYLAFGIWFLAFGSYFFGSRLKRSKTDPIEFTARNH
ncbi:MAG TPA: hypothetical protein VFR08_10115, partial [Candidatus Angelobacter sp.]|nr:hypothetical protein [Candidatus Angelobacter sp.]